MLKRWNFQPERFEARLALTASVSDLAHDHDAHVVERLFDEVRVSRRVEGNHLVIVHDASQFVDEFRRRHSPSAVELP